MVYIIIMSVAVLLVIVLSLYVKLCSDSAINHAVAVSFKESMDITELPIVTFVFKNYENSKDIKLNFLLDSGSNVSVINKSALLRNKIFHSVLPETTSAMGIEGNKIKNVLKCTIPFTYKQHYYEDTFTIQNLDKTFRRLKDENGVNVHGILGTNFFQKYKYVLDFKELIAYMEK